MIARLTATVVLLAAMVPSLAESAAWKIDPAHSSASFQIRHFFSKVQGGFDELSGTIEFDPANPTQAKVEAVLSTASINTKNEKRDGHLRSGDFFDAEKHPQITFKSTKVEVVEGGFRVTGDLTMRGVTKPAVLEVELLGAGPHPMIEGGQIAGFTAKTTVNRQDFGIQWNKTFDNGGAMLGDDVEIQLSVEAIHAPQG